MFTQISVAEAAAIINVVVMTGEDRYHISGKTTWLTTIIVQFTYPLLITLVAVGFLKRTSNAATWSVFGRLIHTSLWPFLLQTDTASGSKVEKRVRIMSVLSIFASVLLAVAAIVTPLGLYSTVIEMEITDAAFSYVRDTSPIGLATQARDTYRANRICGALSIINCPGNDDGHTMENDGTGGGSHFQPHQRGRAFNSACRARILMLIELS